MMFWMRKVVSVLLALSLCVGSCPAQSLDHLAPGNFFADTLGSEAAMEALGIGIFIYRNRALGSKKLSESVAQNFGRYYLGKPRVIHFDLDRMEGISKDETIIPLEYGGRKYVMGITSSSMASPGFKIVNDLALVIYPLESTGYPAQWVSAMARIQAGTDVALRRQVARALVETQGQVARRSGMLKQFMHYVVSGFILSGIFGVTPTAGLAAHQPTLGTYVADEGNWTYITYKKDDYIPDIYATDIRPYVKEEGSAVAGLLGEVKNRLIADLGQKGAAKNNPFVTATPKLSISTLGYVANKEIRLGVFRSRETNDMLKLQAYQRRLAAFVKENPELAARAKLEELIPRRIISPPAPARSSRLSSLLEEMRLRPESGKEEEADIESSPELEITPVPKPVLMAKSKGFEKVEALAEEEEEKEVPRSPEPSARPEKIQVPVATVAVLKPAKVGRSLTELTMEAVSPVGSSSQATSKKGTEPTMPRLTPPKQEAVPPAPKPTTAEKMPVAKSLKTPDLLPVLEDKGSFPDNTLGEPFRLGDGVLYPASDGVIGIDGELSPEQRDGMSFVFRMPYEIKEITVRIKGRLTEGQRLRWAVLGDKGETMQYDMNIGPIGNEFQLVRLQIQKPFMAKAVGIVLGNMAGPYKLEFMGLGRVAPPVVPVELKYITGIKEGTFPDNEKGTPEAIKGTVLDADGKGIRVVPSNKVSGFVYTFKDVTTFSTLNLLIKADVRSTHDRLQVDFFGENGKRLRTRHINASHLDEVFRFVRIDLGDALPIKVIRLTIEYAHVTVIGLGRIPGVAEFLPKGPMPSLSLRSSLPPDLGSSRIIEGSL